MACNLIMIGHGKLNGRLMRSNAFPYQKESSTGIVFIQSCDNWPSILRWTVIKSKCYHWFIWINAKWVVRCHQAHRTFCSANHVLIRCGCFIYGLIRLFYRRLYLRWFIWHDWCFVLVPWQFIYWYFIHYVNNTIC